MTHICVSKLTIIGSDIGLSPDRRQAIIWTNAGLLLIGPLGTYFIEILIEILTFSFKKMHLKVSSAKRRPFCLGLNVFISSCLTDTVDILETNAPVACTSVYHSPSHIEAETKWPPFSRRHFKCIFLNENIWISIKISLKFVPKGPINNIPALVQIMA